MEDHSYAETENIIVHAYDWKVRDKFGDDDNVNIHCWALNRDSEPCLLRFTDFPAFCHLELPSVVRNHKYNWNKGNTDEFMRMLSQRLGGDAPTRYTFKMSKKTYYYRGDRKYPMLQLCFSNLSAMQHCTNILANPLKTDNWGFIKCNIWEDRISIVRKLLTVRDVRFSQWFSINGRRVAQDSKIATIRNEYIVDWDSMTAVSPDESKYWTSKPGILAFDIECYSHNHRAMPDKYNSKDVAYMISCIYQKSTQLNTRKRYGILIGECGHIPPEKLTNCEIIKVETEYQMIEAFARVTNETDPDIFTGYNIFGFDYPYLDHRVRRGLKKWPCMSRIIGESPVVSSKQWKSGAYGHQSINILETEGRISIDLLPVIKREHTRLQKYTLDHVCSKFIGKTKHDVKASEMFLIYENMRTTLTQLVSILREAQNNPALADDPKYIRRAADAQAAFEEAKVNTTRVMEYCIQDSELVIDLMEKLNIWIGLVEMSNIVGVTIVELFTRGQQVRCMSQLYDLASRRGFVIDARDVPGHGFKGGFVFDPEPGLYDNVICLDFSSLYPSIIRAFNIDYTTLVPPELEDTVPDEDCNIIEFDQDEVVEGAEDEDDEEFLTEIKNKKGKQVKTVLKHYRFKYYKHQKGLLPMLVENLVNERRAVNRTLAQTKDWLKADEKTEEVRAALVQYVNGTIMVMSIQEAKQHLEDLSNVKPAPSPDAIRGAKKNLAIAQLFDLQAAQDRLTAACEAKPPTHPKLIEEAELEVQVSEYLASRNQEAITAKIQSLNDTHQQRIERMSSNKVMCVVLNQRQLALKVTANSFFGFLGIRDGGQMPLIEGAMSITATGRRLIGEVREYIEKQYGGKQIYGDTDCVRGHTPILVRYETGAIDYIQIKDLTQLRSDPTGQKEFYDLMSSNIEVWTEQGWSKIKYLMRRKTLKRLYRVVTHTGIVDVSEDHSLLNEQAQEVTPNEIAVGMKLLHHDLPNHECQNPNMTAEKAWAWGFFMAEGTCGSYDCPSGKKNSWSVSNQNQEFLTRAQAAMREAEPNYDFIIDPCMQSSNVDKLTARGAEMEALCSKYDALFYTLRSTTMKQNIATDLGIRFKKVPHEILMATNDIKAAFLQGWYDGDGAKTEGNSRRFDIKGQIGAAGLYHIASALGYKVSINTRTDKEEIYRITLTRAAQRRDPNKIKKIIPLGISLEDVFDVETQNHHFGAGIGRMIVHNSVMVTLPQIKETKECNYWGVRLAQEISGIKPGEIDCDKVLWPEGRPGLFPAPLGMEFEKAMRLLCFKPKMYAALLIGKDGNFKVEEQLDKNGDVVSTQLAMLLKGIILARRDNCKFLRDTYMAILIMVMNRKSIDTALTYLIGRVQDLLSGKIPYTDLSIIRELGANYKSESFFMKVFADELKKAGKFVNPGDRLDFVIIEDSTAALLGQKMKLVEQFSESLDTPTPYKIDYMYYIEHALMNPINALFRVGFKDDIAKLQHMAYRPSNRHKTIHLDRPMQIILKMRQKGYDLEVFKQAVIFNVEKLRNPPESAPLKLHVVKPEEIQPPETQPLKLNIVKPVPREEPPVVKLNIVNPGVSLPATPHLVLPRFAMRQAPVLTLNVKPT